MLSVCLTWVFLKHTHNRGVRQAQKCEGSVNAFNYSTVGLG